MTEPTVDPERRAIDRAMLDRAARLAWRGVGDVEPNPPVGCVIGRIEQGGVATIGLGHHRRFGGPHAEIEALRDARQRGRNARGATVWVTLEPCAHHGKTPPCTQALLEAGVAEVVIARRERGGASVGGADILQNAGVQTRLTDVSVTARRLTDPHAKRIATGLPWVILKWAQTLDGAIATRTGESKWISNERSRAAVHRLRARVDAIITGVGTAIADDPLLTARDVRRVRRIARREVMDPDLRLPIESSLVRTIDQAPVTIVCSEDSATSRSAEALRQSGAEVVAVARRGTDIDLSHALRWLASDRDVVNALVEAGPRLNSRLLAQGLVDELHVYVAPIALGDEHAMRPLIGVEAPTLAGARRFELTRSRRFGDDVSLCYHRSDANEC